jgi:hypothetical protein
MEWLKKGKSGGASEGAFLYCVIRYTLDEKYIYIV